MKARVRILLIVVLSSMGILMLPAIPAVARDYGPLDGWDRTAPYSTYQHWEFTNPDNALPEEFHNPFGEPYAVPAEGEWQWSDEWPCPPGIEDIPGAGVCSGWHCSDQGGGKFVIRIPNQPEPNLYKRIFLQITSSKAPSGISVTGQGGAGGYTSGTFSTGRPHYQEGPPPPPFPGSSWYTYNYGLTVQPNPEYEEITIEVPYCTVIDQIVVDTECIPEPATMALLVLGGTGLIFRRKKRK